MADNPTGTGGDTSQNAVWGRRTGLLVAWAVHGSYYNDLRSLGIQGAAMIAVEARAVIYGCCAGLDLNHLRSGFAGW